MRVSRSALRSSLPSIVVALLLFAVAARAQEAVVPEADRAAIRAVIEQQLAAFARDDAAGAFAFASPAIQRQFGTPDVFMRMVRTAYPTVYRPRAVSFGETRIMDYAIVQQLDLIGPNGTGEHAFYVMEQEEDGSWRINGVAMQPGAQQEI